MVKNLPAMQGTWVWSLDWEDPLEKRMATHSGILAWRIPRTEEPSGLKSLGSQSQTWLSHTHTHTQTHTHTHMFTSKDLTGWTRNLLELFKEKKWIRGIGYKDIRVAHGSMMQLGFRKEWNQRHRWHSRRTCTHLFLRAIYGKMVGQKDMCSSSPVRTTKLQLAAEQPLTGESWIPPKKDTEHPRAKEKPQ